MNKLLQQFDLPNGLVVFLDNDSRHYFGGYYQVIVTVRCELKIDPVSNPECFERPDESVLSGDTIRVSRRLERMGVPEQDVTNVLTELVTGFISTSLPYLSTQAYSTRLVRTELEKKARGAGRRIIPRCAV
jgi:hypothetical protein